MKKFQSVTQLVNIFLKNAQRRRIVPQWHTQEEQIEEEPQDMHEHLPPRVEDFSIPDFGDFEIEPLSAPSQAPKQDIVIQEPQNISEKELEMKRTVPPIHRKVDPRQEKRYQLWGRPTPGFEFESGDKLEKEDDPKSELQNFKRMVENESPVGKADRFSRFMDEADKDLKEKKEQSFQSRKEEEAEAQKMRHEQLVERAKEEMAKLTQLEDILKTHSIVKKKRTSRPQKSVNLGGNRWIEVKIPKSPYKEAHSMWFLVDGRDPDFARNLITEYYKLRDSLRSKKEYLRV